MANKTFSHTREDLMGCKKIAALFLLLGIFITQMYAETKLYDLKSGIIEYAISGGGNIMGVQSDTRGKRRLVFDQWGLLQIQKEQRTSTVMGQTAKTDSITKIDNGIVYAVDVDKKVIIKQSFEMFGQSDNQDMLKMGKEMFKKLGGKQTGTGSMLGYACEIWELMGTKIWIHKGVALKVEAEMMGIKHIEEAVDVKFDVAIDQNEFDIPDLPVKTFEEIYGKDFKEMVSDHMPTQKELEQMQEMMKQFGTMPTH